MYDGQPLYRYNFKGSPNRVGCSRRMSSRITRKQLENLTVARRSL